MDFYARGGWGSKERDSGEERERQREVTPKEEDCRTEKNNGKTR